MPAKTVSDQSLLDAWDAEGTIYGVSRAVNLDRHAVRRRLQRLWLREAAGGKAPVPLAEGFHVTQVTTDGEGAPKSIQSKPDVEEGHLPPVPEGFRVDKVSTYLGSQGTPSGQWVKTSRAPIAPEDMRAAITAHMENYRGSAIVPAVAFPGEPAPELLNMYVWGDPHIGLLSHARETGSNFDLKIACADLRTSADLLTAKAPRADTAIFCEVGDLWHAETDRQVTPGHGNKLDVDGRRSKILEEGLNATRYMVDRLLQRHNHVIVVIVPGNHDPDASIWTRIWLAGIFEGNPRVTVLDNANPYMYQSWGANFFMWTHGDKKFKPKELGEIMLADRPLEVGAALYRRAYTGHIHHKEVEEFRTFRWESFNSLCAPDFWHASSGYRSERLVECITFHKRFGEDSRCRVSHRQLRDH